MDPYFKVIKPKSHTSDPRLHPQTVQRQSNLDPLPFRLE